MHPRYIRLILISGMILALAACGSSRSDEEEVEAQSFGVDADGIAYIGSARCIECHNGPAAGEEEVLAHLGSAHVIHDTGISAESSDFCLDCHDRIGDGRTLESFIDPAHVPESGLAAVGCEACHGAGGEHFGVWPLPHPEPDFHQCGSCHTALPSGPPAHAQEFADSIFEKYTSGGHANTFKSDLAICSRCHSDEGYRALIDETRGFDGDQLDAELAEERLEASSTVQCRTCHDSHSGELRSAPTGDPAVGSEVAPFSQGFNLCTSCHQVFLSANFDSSTGTYQYELDTTRRPYHGVAGTPQEDSWGWVIWDTHFPSTSDGINGYGIVASDEQACTTCHDPHAADLP